LKNDAKATLSNLALQSLFKGITLKMNGTIVNQATGTYPYKSYIETAYTYSSAAKNSTVGALQGYYKDKAGLFNSADSNESVVKRIARFAGSKEVELGGRLHLDLCL